MSFQFNGQLLKVVKWSPDHPYKRTESYLQDDKGKFYSSLMPTGKNGFLFERDGMYGLLDTSLGKAFELPAGLYWSKLKKAKKVNS